MSQTTVHAKVRSFLPLDVLLAMLTAVLAHLPLPAQEAGEDIPTLEEMRHFCETASRNVETGIAVPKIVQDMPVEGEKQVKAIYEQEKKDLQKVALNYQSQNAKRAKEEKFNYLVRLGLFEDALKYLESGEYLSPKDPYAYEYHLHRAFLCRWLGNEGEHNKSFKEAEKIVAKKGQKVNKKNLQERYIKKYLQWTRFSPKFREYREEAVDSPENAEAWKGLAEIANLLGFAVEEIVAYRALYHLACRENRLTAAEVAQLADAYLRTDQPAKVLSVTDAALENQVKDPQIYVVRVKAYLLLKDEERARGEVKTLRKEFPDAKTSYEKIKEELRKRWSES